MRKLPPPNRSQPKLRRPAGPGKEARALKPERSLEVLVGSGTYRVWCTMLAHLVPYGRTQRLAPLVGGMLRYAATLAAEQFGSGPPAGSTAASLLDAAETPDPEGAIAELGAVVGQLFRDARVSSDRVNVRGDRYSVADAAIIEFMNWDLMPWE